MQQDQNQTKKYLKESRKVLGIVFELGFIIALPLLILASFGKWLDARYGKHFFVYIGIFLAIVFTVIWLSRRFSSMVSDLEESVKKEKTLKKRTPDNTEKKQIDNQADKAENLGKNP